MKKASNRPRLNSPARRSQAHWEAAVCLVLGGLLWTCPAFSDGSSSVSSTAASTANSLASKAMEQLKEENPGWLSRTDLGMTFGENFKPIFKTETTQPIYQTTETLRHTLFVQGRFAADDDDTVNAGLGYRLLDPSERWLAGINGFYDRTFNHDHQRIGAGIEWIGKTASLHMNYYHAVSDERVYANSDGAVVLEQALDGWDAEALVQMPYMSWMKFGSKWYLWDSKNFDNIQGYQASLVINLTKNAHLEMSRRFDDLETVNLITISVTPEADSREEWTLFDHLRPDKPYSGSDLKKQTLAKVRRQNGIFVERTGSRNGFTIGRGT